MTVVVGFAALLLTPLVETQSVGIGGLVVVAVAVALSTTLLPALLAVLGRQIDRPRWLARRLTWYHAPTAWERWARGLSRNPLRALAIGGTHHCAPHRAGVLDQDRAALAQLVADRPPRRVRVSRRSNRMGVANIILPVRVLVEVPEGQSMTSAASLRGLRALSDSLRADPRVAQVRSIVDLEPGTSILEYSVLYSDLADARRAVRRVSRRLLEHGRARRR